MTTNEVAASLGCTAQYVRMLASTGKLKGTPAQAKPRRDWQFTPTAIAAYKARKEKGKKS